ncbi:MAG: DUF2147 domain-containing protein [Pseudomonadota bacterium]
MARLSQHRSLCIFVAALMALPALSTVSLADAVVGVWQTEPDRKQLTSHIEVRQCGPRLCGRILRAFTPVGEEVRTRHVGKELFWDMVSLGDGRYDGGTVYVPLLNVTAKASMRLLGDRLRVRGCKGVVCDGQVWTRVR